MKLSGKFTRLTFQYFGLQDVIVLLSGDPLAVSFASIEKRQAFVIIALTSMLFNAIHMYQIEKVEPKWRILNGPICIAEYHQR